MEFEQELKTEYIDIIKKSLAREQLDSRQTIMLFYWLRHKSNPEFSFVEAALGPDICGNAAQKRRRRVRRRPKNADKVV